MTDRMVLTAVDCMTAVGLDAVSTAAAVRAGISRLRQSDQFEDVYGSPILESCIPWLKPEEELPAPEETEPREEDDSEPESATHEDEVGIGGDEELEEETPEQQEEEADTYEVARQVDDTERVTQAARDCLDRLLNAHFGERGLADHAVSLFLGVAPLSRPGPRFEGVRQEVANDLLASIQSRTQRAAMTVLRTGNASVVAGLQQAAAHLREDPSAVCVVGGIDSLLSLETLNWYESAERLKSGSLGRNHGLSPAEAVGFVVAETRASAQREGRPILAEVLGISLATEPDPFLSSDRPSRGQGLSEACRTALAASAVSPGEVGPVVCDFDGEFHRAKEWAFAEIRCFGSSGSRTLLHPADCLGSVGAASAAVLISIAAVAFSRGWFPKPALVFCTDDGGECGAVVLKPVSRPEGSN